MDAGHEVPEIALTAREEATVYHEDQRTVETYGGSDVESPTDPADIDMETDMHMELVEAI